MSGKGVHKPPQRHLPTGVRSIKSTKKDTNWTHRGPRPSRPSHGQAQGHRRLPKSCDGEYCAESPSHPRYDGWHGGRGCRPRRNVLAREVRPPLGEDAQLTDETSPRQPPSPPKRSWHEKTPAWRPVGHGRGNDGSPGASLSSGDATTRQERPPRRHQALAARLYDGSALRQIACSPPGSPQTTSRHPQTEKLLSSGRECDADLTHRRQIATKAERRGSS